VCTDDLAFALATDLDGHFERLVRTYQDRLYGFALRLSGCAPDAEEIAQDAFVRAYRALTRYPPEQIRALALRPWLYKIALNVFRNTRRGRRLAVTSIERGTRPDSDDPEPLDLEDETGDRPEALAEARETRRDLAALLAALPDRYRTAVVLRHVEGMSYLEAAGLLGQPVGTVKANVHRGTKLLRESIRENAAAFVMSS
jgi:RNA polymerase sigma-70 factor (ECF subfamily)